MGAFNYPRSITTEQMRELHQVAGEWKSWPLDIDDNGALSVANLRSKIRRMMYRTGCSFVVVDYLQLMKRERRENANVEVAEVSRALKLIAREFGITLFALSQLSRNQDKSKAQRPTLDRLRDSGAIEQDADVVIFLYRGKVEDELRDGGTRQKVTADENIRFGDMIGVVAECAKNRNGQPFRIKQLCFDGKHQTFYHGGKPIWV